MARNRRALYPTKAGPPVVLRQPGADSIVAATAGAAGLVAALVNAAGGQRGDGPPGNTGPGAQIRVRPIFQGILGLIGR